MAKSKTGKNKHCPYRGHCHDVCYGENPCDHAKKYDLLYKRLQNLQKSNNELLKENRSLEEQLRNAPLHKMDTLKQRDELLREAFLQLTDVPMNPETEVMEAPFLHFPAGTSREEIWKWFDERYSKGIVDLLYHEGIEHHPELQKLFHRRQCCFNCENNLCAYISEGVCMYPILRGRVPDYTDGVGCDEFIGVDTKPTNHKSHDAVMMEVFNRRKPVGDPTGRAYWFTAEFTKGSQCVNDLLRDYLKNHGIEYINTVSGEVWFQFQGEWRRCECEVDGNTVRFYMLEFDRG